MPSVTLSGPGPAPVVAPAYFDRRAAAAFLQISVSRLDVHVREGSMPAPTKIGKLCRFNPRELAAWLDAGAPKRDQWEAMKASGTVTF